LVVILRTKTNKINNTTQKTKQIGNTDPTKKPEVNQYMLPNSKWFTSLIRHSPCYSYS